MNGVQTRLKCKPNVKRCKRFVFAAHSPLLHPNTLKTKAIIHFQTDHILTRFVFPPLFAFPGRINDEYSKGCNRLIRDNKASLLLSAEDLVQAMGWNIPTTSSEKVNVQRSLFLDLSEEEQKIVSILEKQGNLQINSLVVEADIPVHKINAILFELEMKGVVRVLAGGMYQLLN